MKISENWFLTELSGIPYLFPLGQAAADRKSPLKLNQTGVFFWNALRSARDLSSFEEEETARFLLSALKGKEPSLPPDEEVLADIRGFLGSLVLSGALQKIDSAGPSSPVTVLAFGGITVRLEGPSDLLSKELADFQIAESSAPDLTIRFIKDPILKDPELVVAKQEKGTEFSFPDSPGIDRVFLSEDAALAEFTLSGPADDRMRLDVFHAIRLLVSHIAQNKGYFFMHSVSLAYRGKAWLFSAPSGTGKSTHAALWRKLWPNETEDLNGDVNLLQIKDGVAMVHGIPWNGTSGIYSTKSLPLGGITILKRGKENRVITPSEDEKQLSVIQRLISPFWEKTRMNANIAFAGELIRKVPVWHLYCTPKDEAAIVMREAIDQTVYEGF